MRPNKERLNSTLTVYGRKAVIEAFQTPSLHIDKLHLARSNKANQQLSELQAWCEQRGVPVVFHERRELSRISRNGKQDQGVAADIFCAKLQVFDDWLASPPGRIDELRIIALEGVTNPQNLGMTIRSCCGAGVDAIFLSSRRSSSLNPLVIKASAGTAYSAPLVICADLIAAVTTLTGRGVKAYVLRADASHSLFASDAPKAGVFVLGNETDGVTEAMQDAATNSLSIPMQQPVESLNVAVSAALVAYLICQPEH